MQDFLPHHHGDDRKAEDLYRLTEREEDFKTVADLFRLLDDSNRVRIFWILCHCEECVVNISALVNMTSPAVSHHLRQLRDGGLITSRRNGKEVYYRASDTPQSRELHRVIEEVMEIACPEKADEKGGDGSEEEMHRIISRDNRRILQRK